jgi:hypothetical protein
MDGLSKEHQMKHYSAPALVAVGKVVELTQGALMGSEDGSGTQQVRVAGSVGFNL